MTEFEIQEILFDKFKELNTSSGKQYLKQNIKGEYTNVHFPNETFSVPDDNNNLSYNDVSICLFNSLTDQPALTHSFS